MDLANKIRKILFSLVLAACLAVSGLLGSSAEAKADRYFVNYEGNTGYYVDVNSIENISDHELVLDLYLVKLHNDYIYRYQAYFNTAEGSYEYRRAKIYDYATRKVVSTRDHVQDKLSYMKNPMIHEVLIFALDWKKTHMHKTSYGETWE